MTIRELNRDAKRLINVYKAGKHYDGYNISEAFIKEFKRIYHADSGFEDINPKLALDLHRINLSTRIIQLHSFGISREIK